MATDALRTCIKCDFKIYKEEDLELFSKEKKGLYGRRNLCKACNRKKNVLWNALNPELRLKKSKTWHATKVYKISYEKYIERMATSDCCEVCGSKEQLSYDHCHTTMNFRGVLCNKCNRSIGMLGDTLESIEKVLFYLNKEEKQQ